MALILTQPGPFKIDDKRFRLPGCTISGDCPKCKKQFERDLGDHYLTYPEANEPFDLVLWCSECDHEWVVTMRLNITMEFVTEKGTG